MDTKTDFDEVYDLLILVDATYSMFSYLEALQSSLPKIISISQLTSCFSRIGLIAYRDYTEADREEHGMIEWSGWFDAANPAAGISSEALMIKAKQLEPIGGGDYPEATKTGLAKAYDIMRADATTLILLYTDAPPHVLVDGNARDRSSNQSQEKMHLSTPKPYTPKSEHFVDWVSASHALRTGDKKAHVFSFLDAGLAGLKAFGGYYSYLSAVTHGACFYLTKSDPNSISQTTVDILLAWMGTEKAGTTAQELPAKLSRYINGRSIKKLKNESDPAANIYFWASGKREDAEEGIGANIAQVKVTSDVLKDYLPKKKTLVTNFAERYNKDPIYKSFATRHIATLISTDVTAISLNPVFGSLWRAVCNDRENPERDGLLNAFSVQIENIADAEEKARMKAWLEESYDYAAEIKDAIDNVPENECFPCVFLDPTINHVREHDDDGDDDDGHRAITDFRRDELLEIGRSCDHRILRRLGKVLTQLTYVESATDLPAHIAAADRSVVPRIPMVLASKAHGYKFWRILLHIVVPGTMLSARPSTILAALALKMGMKPLFEPASAAMMHWRGWWNDLNVPETWNTSCLSLLIDADDAYSRHVEDISSDNTSKTRLLRSSDRDLFDKLVSYKLAEANLQTTLTAKVGWTPDKTSMPIGPLVICRSCEYPRSVSVMVEKSGGRCGLCVTSEYISAEERNECTNHRVSEGDSEETSATWVECSARGCRAQYVVYNVHRLKVRPKCFYCRNQTNAMETKQTAPWIECRTCLNRILWPQEFRQKNDKPFQCVACSYGRTTIIDVETSALQLNNENSMSWLLDNTNDTLKAPFNKRTLFYTISTTGTEAFAQNIRILRETPGKDWQLFIRGKLIRNTPSLRAELQNWISRRRTEAIPCSLCFSDFHPAKLRPACGRSGCDQRICTGCLRNWYAINRAGQPINTATLHCPFCRRAPAAKTLAAYGMGIHAVGNLRMAVEDGGTWIYAWCLSCSTAKRHTERVCARGAPRAIENFLCEDCVEEEMERLRREEEGIRAALLAAGRADVEEAAALRTSLRIAARNRRMHERPVKNCPKCKMPTQKTAGCDHLECNCGTHWCWACGKAFHHDDIYSHMNEVHGSYYAGGHDVEDDED